MMNNVIIYVTVSIHYTRKTQETGLPDGGSSTKGCFCIISDYTYLVNIGWILIRMDPELEKIKAGSGPGINHSGSTLLMVTTVFVSYLLLP